MTTYQSQTNGYMAYKVQSALGTQASGASGIVFRQTGGSGGKLARAQTPSNEVRADGMSSRGRLGTQKTTGQWTGEASLGSFETILEAVMRDTWSAVLVITEATASLTSITTTASTIVAGAGSWITAGVRVGDVAVLTGHSTAGNNSRDLRITGVTALTLTVAETLTLNATPDAAFTLTIAKKLYQYSASTLVKRYFTIDEYDTDIDLSEVMTDFVWGSAKFSMAPNGLLMLDVGGVGTGQIAAQTTGTSPLLTSPTTSSGVPLSVVDATIRLNGTDMVSLTGLDISLDIKPMAPDVFGSGAIKYAPDVFPGDMDITMNIKALRKDLQFLTDYLAETAYTLHVLAVENESEPKDYFAINVPNFTLGTVDKSALSKQGGPREMTISVPPALVGKDTTGGAYTPTMIAFQSLGA